MDIFTTEEFEGIARGAFGGSHSEIRNGLRFTFTIEHDDESVIDYVNGMDALGRLAWPVVDRYTGREQRPSDFTGAAVKFGPTNGCDTIWWEPYRDGSTVYNGPDERAFMRDLLDYGTVYLMVEVARSCGSCNRWEPAGVDSIGGVESPLCGSEGWANMAFIFQDLVWGAMAASAVDPRNL